MTEESHCTKIIAKQMNHRISHAWFPDSHKPDIQHKSLGHRHMKRSYIRSTFSVNGSYVSKSLTFTVSAALHLHIFKCSRKGRCRLENVVLKTLPPCPVVLSRLSNGADMPWLLHGRKEKHFRGLQSGSFIKIKVKVWRGSILHNNKLKGNNLTFPK